MREIKYRALDVATKKWVYGYYVVLDSGYELVDCIWQLGAKLATPIDRSTLGQLTGLTDKNGKEIYEGDIVKAWNRGISGIFQVKWRNDGVPMYILFPAWQDGEFWNLYDNGSGIDGGIEVIGNIYQHKHLLKENEK